MAATSEIFRKADELKNKLALEKARLAREALKAKLDRVTRAATHPIEDKPNQ